MRSNYKRLGDYIERCDEFNDGMQVEELQGISNNKYFQRSHTNTIGIDLTGYRVVRNNQFAFNRATTRNGDRISIALRNGTDCMVSPSYRIFRSKDENVLLSEYLMMWFRRPEFDRYARFKSHGSAHEFFDYEEMCEVELPIPSIEKQREIVKEYNTIVNRVQLNEQLNQKLEETAQTLYKQWFVDFEFSNDNGNPYKSNGGEMEWNEKLEKEIPKGWKNGSFKDLIKLSSGYAFKGELYSLTNGITVLRGENVTEKKLRWDTHKKWNHALDQRMEKCFLEEYDIVIGMDGSKVGKNWAILSRFDLPLLLAQRVACLRGNNIVYASYLYLSILALDFAKYVQQVQTGTSIPHISGPQILEFPLIVPSDQILMKFSNITKSLIDQMSINNSSNEKLDELKEIVLAKISVESARNFELV